MAPSSSGTETGTDVHLRPRTILHIDMNAFYCSCHAAEEPSLYAKRPTAVAGNPETRHGIVVTASYEARAQGVRTTMTVAQAKAKCPSLILISPDFSLYRKYSKEAFEVVRRYTPQIEIFSIDECFADVTGSTQFGNGLDIAKRIQTELWDELRLPCSIGVAPNKFLAKMASDMKKPRGITILWGRDLPHKLWPLPIGEMFGVGGKTAAKLESVGIATIGHLADTLPERIYRILGSRGLELVQRARGQDNSPVVAERDPVKSIGHSITLAADETDKEKLVVVLMNLADQVGRRLRRHELAGRTITVTIRFASRRTVTRSHTRQAFTQLTEDIAKAAKQLLFQNLPEGSSVRLLGVTVSSLSPQTETEAPGLQLSLFHDAPPSDEDQQKAEKRLRLARVTDRLRDKFGENIIIQGRLLESHESNQIRNHQIRGTSLQKDTLQ